MPIDIMNPEAWQNWDRLETRPCESTTAGYMSCQLALKKSEKIINMIKLFGVSSFAKKENRGSNWDELVPKGPLHAHEPPAN